MSDFDTWWEGDETNGAHPLVKGVAQAAWQASRATLIGEVKPVGYVTYEVGCLPKFNPVVLGKPLLVMRSNSEPVYSADQLATALAKGRAEGLRKALSAVGSQNSIGSANQHSMKERCAAAIDRLIEGEKK